MMRKSGSRARGSEAQPAACDPSSAPGPSPLPSPKARDVIVIDARSGASSYETLHFKRGEKIRVIVDNKTPYLYTYKYTSTAKDVKETALGTFLPLLGGIPDVLSPPDAKDVKAKTAPKTDAARSAAIATGTSCDD